LSRINYFYLIGSDEKLENLADRAWMPQVLLVITAEKSGRIPTFRMQKCQVEGVNFTLIDRNKTKIEDILNSCRISSFTPSSAFRIDKSSFGSRPKLSKTQM